MLCCAATFSGRESSSADRFPSEVDPTAAVRLLALQTGVYFPDQTIVYSFIDLDLCLCLCNGSSYPITLPNVLSAFIRALNGWLYVLRAEFRFISFCVGILMNSLGGNLISLICTDHFVKRRHSS